MRIVAVTGSIPGRRTRGCWPFIILVLIAFAVLAMLACAPPARPPTCPCTPAARLPVPDLERRLEVLDARVNTLAGEVERARRIRAAENEVLLARTKRDRDRAARELLVAKRSP